MTLAGFGIQQSEIARLIDCDAKTLRKYYRRELDVGVTEANVRVAQSLFNLAVKEGNVSACIWWTKARMGWKEAQEVQIGGNGQLITYEVRLGDPPPARTLATAPTIDAKPETEADAAGPLVVTFADGTAA